MIARREFIVALGAGAFAPLAAFAQSKPAPGKIRRIGFLVPRPRPASGDMEYYGGFVQGMRDLGYVEGRDFSMEWRYAEGGYDKLPGLAAELVRIGVDVIVAAGNVSVRAAQQATRTTPIVMGSIDPVGSGFVASLAHPGGNITGVSNMSEDVSPKHVDLLRLAVPGLSRLAVLVTPANVGHKSIVESVRTAGQKVEIKTLVFEAQTPQQIERSFVAMAKERAGAAIVALDAFFIAQRGQIADLAIKQRLPTMFMNSVHVEAGGLMSYNEDFFNGYRRAAAYVDKIFKGAKPGDLPVEQPTIFELVVNRRTAKAIGLVLPQELILRADKVIG